MTIYAFKPDEYSSHMKIISIIGEIIDSSKGRKIRILDVGCSKGFLGRFLDNDNVEWYGLDYDQSDLTIAKKWYKEVRSVDLDGKLPKYPDDFFDVMVMADILEHLRTPERVLSHFVHCARKSCVVVLSTGNVANFYVRLQLLFGNFTYTERGILDKTHLRLFTRKTFCELAKGAGLLVAREEFTPIPLPILDDRFSSGNILHTIHKLNNFVSSILPNVFSFQIILVCTIKKG